VLAGVLGVLKRWDWRQRPTWVTYVPSRSRARLVEGLAGRIAEVGKLPLHPVVRRTLDNPPQSEMENSAYQCRNAWGAFAIDDAGLPQPGVLDGPVLLVDDVARSGWTLTVVGAALRAAGAPSVLPLVLERR
nr:recombinase RecQ [Acidimicrobiia bacterium]